MESSETHRRELQDQFTRQAVPFSQARNMRDKTAIARLVEAGEVGANDACLDVACGPGLVALALANVGQQAVGIDLTPGMVSVAESLRREAGVRNAFFLCGDAYALPFPDGYFDVVSTRFSIHHMTDPAKVLMEMRRVAKPGARVLVCDAVASEEEHCAAAFNRLERLRDPSTVRFLSESQLHSTFESAGLHARAVDRYRVPMELESLLRASFPKAGEEQLLRDSFLRASSEGDPGIAPNGSMGVYFSAIPQSFSAPTGAEVAFSSTPKKEARVNKQELQERLAHMGVALPRPDMPIANFLPCRRSGNTLYVSGQLPVNAGIMINGRVGVEVDVAQAQQAARLCALNILAQVHSEMKLDDAISGICQLMGFVNAGAEFRDHPRVVNGASDFFVEVFGDAGKHSRMAVGVSGLPLGAAVEVGAIFELRQVS